MAFLIALVNKNIGPSSFGDYRTICLLNFTFKIIAKIPASRLSHILPLTISHHQVEFVKGKSIYDHIALAREPVQRLKQKLIGDSFSLKLDISKAFDKLDWIFIKALSFFGFINAWISLINECMCGGKGFILINVKKESSEETNKKENDGNHTTHDFT